MIKTNVMNKEAIKGGSLIVLFVFLFLWNAVLTTRVNSIPKYNFQDSLATTLQEYVDWNDSNKETIAYNITSFERVSALDVPDIYGISNIKPTSEGYALIYRHEISLEEYAKMTTKEAEESDATPVYKPREEPTIRGFLEWVYNNRPDTTHVTTELWQQ